MSLAEMQEGQFSIGEELILVKQSSSIKEEILSQLAGLLQEQGHVKDSFYQALLDREQVFPTGLITQIAGVAIPHTDTSHVNRPAIAVATLQSPVQFQAMDNPANAVPVEIVIMLAIKDSGSQLKMLQKIMQILQNNQILKRLQDAETTAEVLSVIKEHLAS